VLTPPTQLSHHPHEQKMRSSASPRRRRCTVQEKLEILEASRTLSASAAARTFGVSRVSIAKWRADEPQLHQMRLSARRQPGSQRRVLANSFAAQAAGSPVSGAAREISTAAQESSEGAPVGATRPIEEDVALGDSTARLNGGDRITCRGVSAAELSSTVAGRASQAITGAAHANRTPRGPNAASPTAAVSAVGVDEVPRAGDAGARHESPRPAAARAREPATAAAGRTEQASPGTVVLVGFPGFHGTPAELAVRAAFPSLQVGVSAASAACETVGYAHAVDAMDALERGEINYAVVPTTWLLSATSNVALNEFKAHHLQIVAEIVSATHLCLCATPGTRLSECDCVMSDPTLLQEYEAMILDMERQRGAPIVRQAAWDSAGACYTVRDQAAQNIAVIASKDAALGAGLTVLVDAIAGGDARFLVVGRPECQTILPLVAHASHDRLSCVWKTTLVASVLSQSARLADIIRAFGDADLRIVDVHTLTVTPPTNR
jgi:prephenate dehydratase